MIVFQSAESVPDAVPGKVSIGIDAGIESFVATPSELIKSPKFLRGKLRKLKLASAGRGTSTENNYLLEAQHLSQKSPPSTPASTQGANGAYKLRSKATETAPWERASSLQRRLKKKTKNSNNWLKLQKKIAKFHEQVANTRKDWHFSLAHYLCDQADNIFVESPLTPLNKGGTKGGIWAKGLFSKQSLDSGIGGFINEVLPFVCWKRGKFYLKVNKDGTSQECSNCGQHTGKKLLSERTHSCPYCLHVESRDTNSAKIVRNRGLVAVGHPVQEKRDNAVLGVSPMSDCRKKACGDGKRGGCSTNVV